MVLILRLSTETPPERDSQWFTTVWNTPDSRNDTETFQIHGNEAWRQSTGHPQYSSRLQNLIYYSIDRGWQLQVWAMLEKHGKEQRAVPALSWCTSMHEQIRIWSLTWYNIVNLNCDILHLDNCSLFYWMKLVHV